MPNAIFIPIFKFFIDSLLTGDKDFSPSRRAVLAAGPRKIAVGIAGAGRSGPLPALMVFLPSMIVFVYRKPYRPP
ncbi:MAG: hypothetical protein KH208_08645 [Desulfovibrio sp.]|uniref:hypothetical protein n=1 Tax=Desulfovibrio sp. TaxID=885 RepID=UPI0025BA03AD|nr:hypothetical protein [Desulfovibrio sp.]MBS6829922.1 hypothetical protein [Desulfovibrio sp.]